MSSNAVTDRVLREGNRYFVPWALQTLAGGSPGLRRDRATLRIGDASSLTAEARDRIVDAMPVAIVRFLVHGGGWRPVLLASASGERVESVRLGESRIWSEFSLEFTRRSLDLLITLYNNGTYEQRHLLERWHSGDILLWHFLRVRTRESEREMRSTRAPYDPFSVACSFTRYSVIERALSALWDELEAVLPWLSFHLAHRWSVHFCRAVSGTGTGLRERCGALAEAIELWAHEVGRRGRPDLARPLVMAAGDLADWIEDEPTLMTRMAGIFASQGYEGQRMRQSLRDDVAEPLAALLHARNVHHDCLEHLPFERDAHQKAYLRECDRLGAQDIWRRIDRAVADLEGRIG